MEQKWIFQPTKSPAVEDDGYQHPTDERGHVTACFDGTFSALLWTSDTQCLYRDGFGTLAKAKECVQNWINKGK